MFILLLSLQYTDLDLGHYERFLNQKTSQANNVTTGVRIPSRPHLQPHLSSGGFSVSLFTLTIIYKLQM